MKTYRILLLAAAVLVFSKLPAFSQDLMLDVGLSQVPQAGWNDFLSVPFAGATNPSFTNANGITVTLDGQWEGRTLASTYFVPNGSFTDQNILRSISDNIEYNFGPNHPNGNHSTNRTVTITGLQANVSYSTSLWGAYPTPPVGWDLLANGTPVVTGFLWTSVPDDNLDDRMDFNAVADGTGKVVLTYKNPTSGFAPDQQPFYVISAISMTAVPEPASVILSATGLLAVVGFAYRKKRNAVR